MATAVWMVMILVNDQAITITSKQLETSLMLLMGSVIFLGALFLSLRFRIGKRSGYALISVYSVYIVVTIATL